MLIQGHHQASLMNKGADGAYSVNLNKVDENDHKKTTECLCGYYTSYGFHLVEVSMVVMCSSGTIIS